MPQYIHSIKLPEGTRWSASIIAEEGYNAGVLNKTSGIMTANDSVYATEATSIDEPSDIRGWESKNFTLEHLDRTDSGSYIGYWMADPHGYLVSMYPNEYDLYIITNGVDGALDQAFNNKENPIIGFGIHCRADGTDSINILFNKYFSELIKRKKYTGCTITLVEVGTAIGSQVYMNLPIYERGYSGPIPTSDIGDREVNYIVNHNQNAIMNFVKRLVSSYKNRVDITLLTFTRFYPE